MAGSLRDPVRVAHATSALDPHASEEIRHLMQARLGLLGFVTLALGGGFLVVSLVLDLVLDGPDVAMAHIREPRGYLNAAGAAVSLLVWLAARRGRRSPAQLLAIDASGSILAVVPYTLMAVLGGPGLVGILETALTVMLVLQTRALMIPSDAQRTFGISATAAALSFGLGIGAHVAGWVPSHELSLGQVAANLGMWLVVIVAVSTVASWVLFGLRKQVEAARRLGQYTLDEKIGEGGMGVVYRAHHALLRRPTAIKLLPVDRAGEAAVKRFEKEVQLTASLVHPNTVTIFDYGRTSDGVFYYAMEYLDGGDLEAIVDVNGPLPPARVVHILAQVASGLAEAHEIGLIHRDIKPANIYLASQGPVADLAKLLDFGLVRELSDAGTAGATRDDTVLGTPMYMAPESITMPAEVDARVDVYALGAVGYFLLTGEHVFEGRTVVEICSHHLHTKPQAPSVRLGAPVPAELEALIMRCLAKDRNDRPQTAEELRELLERCGGVGVWTRADARRWWKANGDEVRSLREGDVSVAHAPTEAVDVSS